MLTNTSTRPSSLWNKLTAGVKTKAARLRKQLKDEVTPKTQQEPQVKMRYRFTCGRKRLTRLRHVADQRRSMAKASRKRNRAN